MRSKHHFKTQEELVASLAHAILESLKEALRSKEYATLLLSGGTTPKPLLEYLSKMVFTWERVRVGLVDERFVPPTDPASNELLVRTHLLVNEAKSATFFGMWSFGMWREEDTYEAMIAAANERYAKMLFPFDVVVLGMGEDAHTASLFPRNEALHGAYTPDAPLLVGVTPENAPHKRISLSKRAILESKQIFLHFEGEKKCEVFETAMQSGDAFAYPIGAIAKESDMEVYYR